jgi:hypothetical protein
VDSAWLRADNDLLRDKVKRLEAMLGECYRVASANPDAGGDWRLTPLAVQAVRELRASYDAIAD